MELHPTQKVVAQDNHTYRVVCCGRQWGKTTLAVLEMIACAYAKGGRRVAYFATTFDQARNIAWVQLKEATRAVWVKPPNESRLELSIKTQDGGISELSLRGFENIETARGQQWDFLVIDEVASLKNWDYAWEAILEPALAFRKGKALFISTPRGFNFFHEMYLKGQEKNDYWKSWRFTTYDNPYFPQERIEQAKKTSTVDHFAQEYLADFRKFTGLVYKAFQREIHVIEPFDIPESWQSYRALDFGSTNPTACLWIGVDGDDNWYIVGEHYAAGNTIDYHAGVINSHPLSPRVTGTFGDPSGAQWIQEFAQRGIYITPATKEIGQAFNTWVTFGIDKVAQKLKLTPGHSVPGLRDGVRRVEAAGLPQLFVFSSCVNTIREFETYRWKEKAVTQAQDLNEPDVPEKANDHALDALRYFAVSYQRDTHEQPLPQYKPADEVIGL